MKQEPVGRGKFPDFGLTCNGARWFVEVTTILGDIREDRVIDVTGRDVAAMANLAASARPIDEGDIEKSTNGNFGLIDSSKIGPATARIWVLDRFRISAP